MAQLPAARSTAKNQPREIIAWCLYDWANSAYSTIYITVLVLYMQGAVLKGDTGLTVWGWGIGVTTLMTAILSPMLGAIADAQANKRGWLFFTTMLGAGASVLMFFGTPERPWFFVAMFLIANLCYELVQCFYNAFLPEIADDAKMSEVSAWGYGTGYVGGGLMLLVAIVLLRFGESLGLPTENYFLPRLCLLVMGLWWALFSLPILLIVQDKSPPRYVGQSLAATAATGAKEVMRTLRDIRRYKMLAIFLVGFLIFNDGVMTVISQASVYAKKQFFTDSNANGTRDSATVAGLGDNGSGLIRVTTAQPHPFAGGSKVQIQDVEGAAASNGTWTVLAVDPTHFDLQDSEFKEVYTSGGTALEAALDDADLIPVFLMIQFVALPGAVFLGWFANKIGQKNALHLCLAVWIVVLISGFLIRELWQFYIMAAVTALVLGGTQSVSRTIMGLMTPESRTGEFFGFFNLSGKAFSMLGPIMFTEILKRTGSPSWAILSLLLFFLVGWAIIGPLDIARGQREAREGLDAA